MRSSACCAGKTQVERLLEEEGQKLAGAEITGFLDALEADARLAANVGQA
jgi:hypothetical protein